VSARASRDVVTARALNRALLDRRLLLGRSPRPVLAAIEHLVGLHVR
jgi:hypothetical protein